MELTFRLKQTPDIIFDYLTDMQKFVSFHPVIFQIDNLGSQQYLVHEKLKLGFIPISFTYPVTIEKNQTEKWVIIHATVLKLTKIRMKFIITTENEFTVVNESILFKSPLPIKYLMQGVFRNQHAQLFKNMEAK